MDLQLNGKCVKVFETEYTSKKDGQKHQKHHFVIGVQDGNFTKNVCFTVLDDVRWSKMGVIEGGTYNVSFDVSSREYNGNWYTDINAWRAIRVDINAQSQSPMQPVMPTQQQPAQQPVQQPLSGGYVQQQNSNDVPF